MSALLANSSTLDLSDGTEPTEVQYVKVLVPTSDIDHVLDAVGIAPITATPKERADARNNLVKLAYAFSG